MLFDKRPTTDAQHKQFLINQITGFFVFWADNEI